MKSIIIAISLFVSSNVFAGDIYTISGVDEKTHEHITGYVQEQENFSLKGFIETDNGTFTTVIGEWTGVGMMDLSSKCSTYKAEVE